MKADQVRGQPPHRPHEQKMQGDIDQRRRQHRDRQRYQQQVAGKTVHRAARSGASSTTISMNCRAARRRADDAYRLVAGFQHGLEGIDDRRPCRHRPHVDVMVDRRRQIGAGQQPALLAHLDGDRARTDTVEDFPRQRIRNHARGGGIQHQRRGIGRRQPVVQPVHPEIGDRGHIDQHFRDHHQRNGRATTACRTGRAGAAAVAAAFRMSAVLRSLTRSLPLMPSHLIRQNMPAS